ETGLNVLFVSNDTGLRMKLPTRSLTAVAPSPADRLPDELDEVEKEAAELRQRLDRYENRLPKLKRAFNDWKSFNEIDLLTPKENPPDLPPSYAPGYDSKSQIERSATYVS